MNVVLIYQSTYIIFITLLFEITNCKCELAYTHVVSIVGSVLDMYAMPKFNTNDHHMLHIYSEKNLVKRKWRYYVLYFSKKEETDYARLEKGFLGCYTQFGTIIVKKKKYVKIECYDHVVYGDKKTNVGCEKFGASVFQLKYHKEVLGLQIMSNYSFIMIRMLYNDVIYGDVVHLGFIYKACDNSMKVRQYGTDINSDGKSEECDVYDINRGDEFEIRCMVNENIIQNIEIEVGGTIIKYDDPNIEISSDTSDKYRKKKIKSYKMFAFQTKIRCIFNYKENKDCVENICIKIIGKSNKLDTTPGAEHHIIIDTTTAITASFNKEAKTTMTAITYVVENSKLFMILFGVALFCIFALIASAVYLKLKERKKKKLLQVYGSMDDKNKKKVNSRKDSELSLIKEQKKKKEKKKKKKSKVTSKKDSDLSMLLETPKR